MKLNPPTFIRRILCKLWGHKPTQYVERSFHLGEAVGVMYVYWCGQCGRWLHHDEV